MLQWDDWNIHLVGGVVMKSGWLIIISVLVLSAGLFFAGACGSGDDDDDSSGGGDEYFCTCTCYTPIGNVDRGHYVCASNEDEAFVEAEEAQDNSPCDYAWTCGKCEKTGDDC